MFLGTDIFLRLFIGYTYHKKKENNESLLIIIEYKKYGASPVAQGIRLPTQETWVRSLCREDPLEKGRATNSSILLFSI